MRNLLKYIFGLGFLFFSGCNSDVNVFNSIVLSDNVEIYCEEVYNIHHLENTKVIVYVKNSSNYEIKNIFTELTFEKLDKTDMWESTNNVSYNKITEKILPYETAVDTLSISAEGIYRVGYKLYMNDNSNESELMFSPRIIVIQKRTILPFRNIVPTRFFSTIFYTQNGSFYTINSLEDLDSVKSDIVHYGDRFYSLLENENFSDSTFIGYTTAGIYGSGARLVADSLVNIRDTIWVNYTFDTHSVYQDVVGHTSIIAIKKTNLPILIGEFNMY